MCPEWNSFVADKVEVSATVYVKGLQKSLLEVGPTTLLSRISRPKSPRCAPNCQPQLVASLNLILFQLQEISATSVVAAAMKTESNDF